MILIVTFPEDLTAQRVERRLLAEGADIVRFDAADFPARARVTVAYRDGKPRYIYKFDGRCVHFDELEAVWFRKPSPPQAHPSIVDEEVRSVIEQDCAEFLTSVWDSLPCRVLPGTPSTMRTAQRKASQMGLAQKLGFEVPPTLFTNDPDEFIDLYREQGGRLISKIIASLTLRTRMGHDFARYTNAVTTRDVAHANSVAHGPIVLQAYVPKRMELRVTVVLDRVFTAQIESQATNRTRFDWRRYDLGTTPHREHALPAEVEEMCRRMVADSGLTYGAIDLILTPDGRYVFLELNSAGEYDWIEQVTGLPIGAAIADFLLGRTSDIGRDTESKKELLHA